MKINPKRLDELMKPNNVSRVCVSKSGIVLDPFAGSGTTGCACKRTERPFIMIEREEEYCEIARRRIESTKPDPRVTLF